MASIKKTVIVDRRPDELYRFWHNLENLSHLMKHLKSITELGNGKSHWVVETPLGKLEWDAKIIEDRPNNLIKWRSLPGTEFMNEGAMKFNRKGKDRTEVVLEMSFDTHLGFLDKIISIFLESISSSEISEALKKVRTEIAE